MSLLYIAGAATAQTSGEATASETTQVTDEQLSQQAASFRKIIATLETEAQSVKDRIEVSRSELKDLQADRDALGKELDGLKQEQAEFVSEAQAAREAEIANLSQARDAIQAETDAANAQKVTLTSDIAELQQIKGEIETQVADAQNALDAASEMSQKVAADQQVVIAERDAVVAQRDAVVAETETLQAELVSMRAEQEQTQVAIDELQQKLQELATPAASETSTNALGEDANQRASTLEPTRVANAITAAPGLNLATPEQRAKLQALLTDGVCTFDALSAVFSQVNRQTLVSLVRDLGRC